MVNKIKALLFSAAITSTILSGCTESYDEKPVVYLDAPYYLNMIYDLQIYTNGHLSTLDGSDVTEISAVVEELERYNADIDLLLSNIDNLPKGDPEAEEYTTTFKELLEEANIYVETAMENAYTGSTSLPNREKLSGLLSQLSEQISDFRYEEK